MAEGNQEQVQVEENNTGGFYERLTALPVVSEAINQTGAIYNAVKGHNNLTQYACDTGESVVKKVTTTAYSVGTPIAGMALKVAEPYVGNPGLYFTIFILFFMFLHVNTMFFLYRRRLLYLCACLYKIRCCPGPIFCS
jgi:hypothetical protein